MAGKSRKYISFDSKGYINTLQQEMKRAMYEVRNLIQQRAIAQARALPLKKIKTVYYKGRKIKQNEVRLADGSTTSDASRRDALIQSIVNDEVKWQGNNILKTAVRAMANNFKESHIGWYYEYGTGSSAENLPPTAHAVAAAGIRAHNPYRHGSSIVTRSAHVDGGTWVDLGGNLRITRSPRGGETDEGFRKAIGQDVEAYHWFRQAYEMSKTEVFDIYKEALKRVHPGKFMKVRHRIVLGRD